MIAGPPLAPVRTLPLYGPPLADAQARQVRYLRVSVTDRCNYRCTYCMPEQGVELSPRSDVLAFEEIARLARLFSALGVRTLRLTGGEPTVRRDLVDLVALLAAIPGVDDLALTTNGHTLAALALPLRRAGLGRINVSLDTLSPERFAAITRRGELARVLAGLDAAVAAGFAAVKLNVVALRGFNDDEVGALCSYAWARGVVPRFIEHMPMSEGALFAPGALMPAAAIRAAVEAAFPGATLRPEADDAGAPGAGPARYWRLEPGGGRVGIISALTEHFCDSCNRVRLSATGQLHTCLAYDDATDLRGLARAGADDAQLAAAIRAALAGKRPGHGFTASGCGAPRKHMVSIGG